MSDLYHAVPPANGGWYKIVRADENFRAVETKAIISPDLPRVDVLVGKMVNWLNQEK
jgi:hypothetical protein